MKKWRIQAHVDPPRWAPHSPCASFHLVDSRACSSDAYAHSLLVIAGLAVLTELTWNWDFYCIDFYLSSYFLRSRAAPSMDRLVVQARRALLIPDC